MIVVNVVIWDADGSRQLRQDGRVPRITVRGGTDATPPELLDAVRCQLGFDATLLRIGSDDTIEVEPVRPFTSGGLGVQWQESTMSPPVSERPPWHRPGWLGLTVHAVDAALTGRGLTRVGPVRQVRHTSVTGMFRIDTDRFPLWLKAVLPIFAHEGSVVEWLSTIAPGHVPDVVANATSWWLAREFPKPGAAARTDYLGVLADLQIASISRTNELRALGCADRSAPTLPPAVESVVTASDTLKFGRRRALRSVLHKLDRACVELTALGLPVTVVHGDLTTRNVLWTNDGWFLFDWTDACIAPPFVDLAVALADDDGPTRARRTAEYGRRWHTVLPAAAVDRCLELAPALGAAHQVVTYQWIFDSFEQTGGDPQGGHEMTRLLNLWTDHLVHALGRTP